MFDIFLLTQLVTRHCAKMFSWCWAKKENKNFFTCGRWSWCSKSHVHGKQQFTRYALYAYDFGTDRGGNNNEARVCRNFITFKSSMGQFYVRVSADGFVLKFTLIWSDSLNILKQLLHKGLTSKGKYRIEVYHPTVIGLKRFLKKHRTYSSDDVHVSKTGDGPRLSTI